MNILFLQTGLYNYLKKTLSAIVNRISMVFCFPKNIADLTDTNLANQ